jgi:tetratricopeptide (TPR) repeat protein
MAKSEINLKLLKMVWLLIIPLLLGCMSWEEGWDQIGEPQKKGDVNAVLATANYQIMQADNKEKVLQLVKTYESVLEIDPYNYEALWSLGRYYLLLGLAYTNNPAEKNGYFIKAIAYCERGMYTNPDFKSLIDKGKKPWEACMVLSKKEIEAIYYWYAAVGSYYKESLNLIGQLVNFRWGKRLRVVIEKMLEIDPTWAGGHPYWAMGLYYSNLPGFMGGDMEKARNYFDKAVEAGPNWLYTRWGRAKYLFLKEKNKKAFKNDMEWIIDQDPAKADSPYPWNLYFQRDAKNILANIEDDF